MNPGATLELRDIHLPSEPSWWPPAPGWWLLSLLALLLLWQLWRALRRVQRRRRRVRLLLDELRRIEESHPVAQQPKALLVAYSGLLRRACRQFAPNGLTLTDEDWLRFLDADDPQRPFSEGPGRLLLLGPFEPSADPAAVQALQAPLRKRLCSLAERADA
jgi:hypothetical protein